MKLVAKDVHDLIASALERSDTSPENATSVAAALVAAELAGHNGQGLRLVEAYCAQTRSGKVDGMATLKAAETRPGTLVLRV